MQNIGAALVLVAVLFGAAACAAWSRTPDEGVYVSRSEPDRAPAFALGGVGGVLFISGVIVMTGAALQARRDTDE